MLSVLERACGKDSSLQDARNPKAAHQEQGEEASHMARMRSPPPAHEPSALLRVGARRGDSVGADCEVCRARDARVGGRARSLTRAARHGAAVRSHVLEIDARGDHLHVAKRELLALRACVRRT
eukprot:5071557-Pleurochrysis_carterae.AAC.1